SKQHRKETSIMLDRRSLVKLGLASAAVPFSALAQDLGSEAGARGKVGGRSESELFLGNNMPGGGQLEIRLTASIYTSDPDQLETDQRMMPSYKKMRETFDKAWKMTRAPFERIQVNYEGTMLDGYFRKPNGPAGKRFPTMIAFQGADTMAEATILGGGAYAARG